MPFVKPGSTDVTQYFNMRNTSDGQPATGLAITAFDMTFTRSGEVSATKVDALALIGAGAAHDDNRGFEVNATDQPGLYRFDWPDAAFLTGVREVILTLRVDTAVTEHIRMEFTTDLVDALLDEVNTGATHNVQNSVGKQIRQGAAFSLTDGTLQSATSDTAVLDAGEDANDEFFSRMSIAITGGLGEDQQRVISDYDGTTKTVTVTPPWVVIPDSSSAYTIFPGAVHTSTQNGGYDNGTVYVNTVDGTPGVLIGVHGTTTNPSDNIADARTIADILNLKMFFIAPGSVITLAQSFDAFSFSGAGGTVNLGGQSISGSIFRSVQVSGIGTGTNDTLFVSVRFSGPTQLENPTFFHCDLFSNITFTGADFIGIHDCFNSSGTTTILDFGSTVGNTHVNMVVNGDFEIQNMGQTDTDTLDYNGIGILVFGPTNKAGGEAVLIGNPELTDTSTAGFTITDITASLKLDDIQGAGFDTSTDSLVNIRDDGVNANVTKIEGQTLIDGQTIIGTYRIFGAAAAGKSSVNGSKFRSMDDLKDRITATVDGSSNRTAVALDGTA